MAKNDMNSDTSAIAIQKGSNEIKKRLDQHLEHVLSIRKTISIKNSDLVTDELAPKIPAFRLILKKKVSNLRSELKEIIWKIAAEHEKHRFEPLKKDFEQISSVSKHQLDRGKKVLENEQEMFISYNSLFFACKACADVNKEMLKHIEGLKFDGKKVDDELELLLKNAIIVYEVTNMVIEMIQDFRLQGFEEFQKLRDEVLKELKEAERNSRDNVETARGPGIPQHQREDTEERHRRLIESANLVRMQWQRFEDQIWSMQQNTGELSKRLTSLGLTRDNAKVQLDFLELVAVTQMMNQNVQAIEGLSNLELELAPLSPDDVRRLIGLDGAYLASNQPIP